MAHYVHCQLLWPQREPQLPSTSLEDSPRPGNCGPGFYGVTAFALGPSAGETLCVTSKNEVCFPESFDAPEIRLHWLSKPNGAFSSQCHTPRLGSLAWDSELSLLWKNFYSIINSLVCGLPTLVVKDLIISRVHPSYCLKVSSLCLWILEYLFFFLVDSSLCFLMVFQQLWFWHDYERGSRTFLLCCLVSVLEDDFVLFISLLVIWQALHWGEVIF